MDNIPKSYHRTSRARAAGSDLARFLRQLAAQVTSTGLASASARSVWIVLV